MIFMVNLWVLSKLFEESFHIDDESSSLFL